MSHHESPSLPRHTSAYLGGGWSPRTLRRFIGNGELPFYRRGAAGKILVRKADLERFMAGHRKEGLDLDALAAEALAEMGGPWLGRE